MSTTVSLAYAMRAGDNKLSYIYQPKPACLRASSIIICASAKNIWSPNGRSWQQQSLKSKVPMRGDLKCPLARRLKGLYIIADFLMFLPPSTFFREQYCLGGAS